MAMFRVPRITLDVSPIFTKWAASIAESLESLMNLSVAPPLELSRNKNGYALRLVGGAGITIALSGSGGVAARSGTTPGSGTVTLYSFNGTTISSGSTVTAYNMGASSVAGNTYLMLMAIGGYWFVVWEDCG